MPHSSRQQYYARRGGRSGGAVNLPQRYLSTERLCAIEVDLKWEVVVVDRTSEWGISSAVRGFLDSCAAMDRSVYQS